MIAAHSELFPILFVPGFAAMWILIMLLLAHLSGWRTLQKKYALKPRALYGKRIKYIYGSGRFQQINYNNCVKVSAVDKGLLLRIMPGFNLWQSPLLIPWDAIDDITPTTFPTWVPKLFTPGNYEIKLKDFPKFGLRLSAKALDQSGAMEFFQKSRR
jgi:hypothetical protein